MWKLPTACTYPQDVNASVSLVLQISSSSIGRSIAWCLLIYSGHHNVMEVSATLLSSKDREGFSILIGSQHFDSVSLCQAKKFNIKHLCDNITPWQAQFEGRDSMSALVSDCRQRVRCHWDFLRWYLLLLKQLQRLLLCRLPEVYCWL